MFPMRLFVVFFSVSVCFCATCATPVQKKPTDSRFYRDEHVRRCLQTDKSQKTSDARNCWIQLLKRLQSDDQFRARTELNAADIAKIRSKVEKSMHRSVGLRRKIDQCSAISIRNRKKRLDCFQRFLDKHKQRLSVSERYEVEAAIKWVKKGQELEEGKIKHTVEHAGLLLGAKLHLEEEGIRIDQVMDGPLRKAECPEQGIVVAIDGIPLREVDSDERISRLEACQERTVSLLTRKGDIEKVLFIESKASCTKEGPSALVGRVQLDAELCTQATSPELSLGISWCYIARDGVLEVVEVYRDSPADKAGVLPEHELTHINEVSILGKPYQQIELQLSSFPKKPLRFRARGSSLASPESLVGPGLSQKQVEKFWQAIQTRIEMEEKQHRTP